MLEKKSKCPYCSRKMCRCNALNPP